MHSVNFSRYEIHAFHGRKVLMKYRLQKITSDSVIYYMIQSNEIIMASCHKMRFTRKRMKKWNLFLLNSPWRVVPSYRCREKWIRENSFERRWIIGNYYASMKDCRNARARETREDDRSAAVYLEDDNKIARSNGNRIREQTWLPQGLAVQSGRSGACGFQAKLQGNGDDRANHRRP